ncbi:amidohydrolase family protein [Ideonella sp. TBM-1]|uniref:Amidohydrolase family protein n=2 Tax=Ideonella livida TaxID=2707176 RepID=A0A7C9TL91_9BURK|nr:amidohydrolase family protein [Ideonella livida]
MARPPRRAGRWAAGGLGAGVALAVLAVLGACSGGPEDADLVLRNGYVYTVDATDSVQQAVAVKDGRIVYVGTDAGAEAHVGRGTRVMDLGGRMLMPGFVDAHLHSLAGGRALLLCDLKYASLTRAQMQVAIQACLDGSASKEPDAWLEVVNWSRQGTQAVDADPDKTVLDALTTRRPILVRSSDFHTALVNSRALALAGITRDTPDPAGGAFAHNSAGEPNGICEDAASWQVAAFIPPDSDTDKLAQGRAALLALRTQGVTTFMDAASGADHGVVFTTLQKAGELTARAFFAVQISPDEAAADPAAAVAEVQALATRFDQGTPQVRPTVRFRHAKLFVDGVVNAPADTGALLTPYFTNVGTAEAPHWVAGENLGNLYFPAEVLNPVLRQAAQASLDVHMHATGDRAVRTALDGVAQVRTALPGVDWRPAIAHNETVDPADDARFGALDVTATFSFQWAQRAPYSVGETEHHLGPTRFARMEPSGHLHQAGARVAFGSDWPIDPFDQLLALKIGVTRAGDPESPNGFGPDFAGPINNAPGLSRAAVLRAITLNAAHQLRMERQVGSIAVGKFADFIVLDKNFMQVPEEELARNQVLLTVVGGQAVHALAPFTALAPASAAALQPLSDGLPTRRHALAATAAPQPTVFLQHGRRVDLRASTGHAVVHRPGQVHGDGHNH